MAFLHRASFIVLALSFVASQSTAPTNPYANYATQFPAIITSTPAELTRLASIVKQLNPNATPFIPVTTTTTSTNPFDEAVTAIKALMGTIVRVNEPDLYRLSFFTNITLHMQSQFNTFTSGYDQAINALAQTINIMNQDDNQVINDLQIMVENLPTYNSNYTALDTRVSTLLKNLPEFADKQLKVKTDIIDNRVKKINESMIANIARARSNTVDSRVNLTRQIDGTFSRIGRAIDGSKINFQSLIKNFTDINKPRMAAFNATLASLCQPIENILAQTANNVKLFQNYITSAKNSNYKLMADLANQATNRLKRAYDRAKSEYLLYVGNVTNIIATQSSSYMTDTSALTSLTPKIQEILTKTSDFVTAQKTAITTKNTEMAAITSLASANSNQAKILEPVGNISLIVNSKSSADVSTFVVGGDRLTNVTSDIPQEYPLKFLNPFPTLPTTAFELSNGFEAADVTQFTLSATTFTKPQNLDTTSGPACISPVDQTKAFPAKFSPYPCFDPAFLASNSASQTPPVPGIWVKYSVPLPISFSTSPYAAMVTLNLARLPDPPAVLSVQKGFDVNAPIITNPTNDPAATLNGYNNFVIASYYVVTNNIVNVFVMLSDVQAALRAGLTARVAITAI